MRKKKARKTSPLQVVKNWKAKACKGVKGAKGKMDKAASRYVKAEGKKAAPGKKMAAKKAARAKVNKIIKGSCSR